VARKSSTKFRNQAVVATKGLVESSPMTTRGRVNHRHPRERKPPPGTHRPRRRGKPDPGGSRRGQLEFSALRCAFKLCVQSEDPAAPFF